jgi:general secretion pathway protein A
MYLEHWNLRQLPFENAPNPGLFYPSPMHEEALARLHYVVLQGKSAAMITGAVGCGKTVLSQTLMQRLNKDRFQVAAVTNPAMGPLGFIQTVKDLFQAPNGHGTSKAELWQALVQHLKKNSIIGRRSLLVIDEAQLIHDEKTLEELRMLMNLQSADRMLLSVILLGQLGLERRIERIAPLNQRISIRYKLFPFSFREALSYIKHRLQRADCQKIPFTANALRSVYRYTQGIPREINSLCDRSMLAAFLAGKRIVDQELVTKARKDLRG